MHRLKKRFLLVAAFILLSFIINSYVQNQNDRDPEYPKILHGIPTYPGSRLNARQTSTGDPTIFVFYSSDSLEEIREFYYRGLNQKARVIEYANRWMVIYQYDLEKPGEDSGIPNVILRGVELIPLNGRYRRIYKARVKIKIIVPRADIEASRPPQSVA